jgi:hypothetical protein
MKIYLVNNPRGTCIGDGAGGLPTGLGESSGFFYSEGAMEKEIEKRLQASEIRELIEMWRIQAKVREEKVKELSDDGLRGADLNPHLERMTTLRECADELELALKEVCSRKPGDQISPCHNTL